MDKHLTGSLKQNLFIGILVLFFVAVSIQYSYKVMKGKSAINRWAPQIQQMEAGEDIHKNFNYPNPPIMALILYPISELVTLNPMAGALTWFYLKVILAIISMLLAFRICESAEQPFPLWAKIATILLSLRPIMGDLTHGNVNIFILFLVISSLYSFKRGYDIGAGIILALAIACKVTPLMFVAYFVWKRSVRVILGASIGLVLFFLVLPALALGWNQNLHSLHSWFEVMIVPYVVGGVVTPEHNNQSLPGLLERLITSAPSFSTYIGDLYIPLRYDNFIDVGPQNARIIVKLFMFLFGIVILLTCRSPINIKNQTKQSVRDNWYLSAEYALIIIGMLLFSERTWKHHCVILLLPFAVIVYALINKNIGRTRRLFLGGALVLATGFMATTATGLSGENMGRLQDEATAASTLIGPGGTMMMTQQGIWTTNFGKQAQVYGAFVWAFICLVAGLSLILLSRSRELAGSCLDTPANRLRKAG